MLYPPQVEQPDILPTEMMFTIKEYPKAGHVVRLASDRESTAAPVLDYIQAFTQEDINKGRILYVSTSAQGSDAFTVDVSNGFTSVDDVEVRISTVPRLIPVQTFNFTVREGGAVALSQELLNISHAFYRMNNIDFIVDEAPQHGDIRYLEGDEYELTSFTWDEVSAVAILTPHTFIVKISSFHGRLGHLKLSVLFDFGLKMSRLYTVLDKWWILQAKIKPFHLHLGCII